MLVKVTNGVPENYTISLLRKDNPNTSFTKRPSNTLLEEYSVYPCAVAEMPSVDTFTQKVVEGGYSQVNGSWVKGWDVVPLSDEEKAAQLSRHKFKITGDAQRHLDQAAIDRGYDSAERCISYITSTNTVWAADANTMNVWRDGVWSALFTILTDVEAGTRAAPAGFEDIEAELPALVWP